MNSKEIKQLTIADLQAKIASERETLRKFKFAHAISPIENPMKIRSTRRLIASLATELTSKIAKSQK